jgi:hypothetical protein
MQVLECKNLLPTRQEVQSLEVELSQVKQVESQGEQVN